MKNKAKPKKIKYPAHWKSCRDCCNCQTYLGGRFNCYASIRFQTSEVFKTNNRISPIGYIAYRDWFKKVYTSVTGKKFINYESTFYDMNENGACPFHNMDEGSKELGQQAIFDEIKRLGIKNKLKVIK